MDYLPFTWEQVDNLDEDEAADFIERLQESQKATIEMIAKLFGARMT